MEVMDEHPEGGFTLIELLVVVAIIGILAAVAIPQFAEYRSRAFDARAESDLRNVMTAQEAYYVDAETYTANSASLIGFSTSPGITLTIQSADDARWQASTYHSSGTTTYCYDTLDGGGIVTAAGLGAACP